MGVAVGTDRASACAGEGEAEPVEAAEAVVVAEPDRLPVTADLDDVLAALRQWMRDTRASQLGCTFNVTDPRGADGLADWLIAGSGVAGGPVTAVLRTLGVDVVESCAACRRTWPSGTPRVRICGECGHLWETADELVEHDYRVQTENRSPILDFSTEAEPPKRRSAAEIVMCPCCGHDF